MSEDVRVELRGVSFGYEVLSGAGREASLLFDDLDLQLSSGELVAVVGPNGAGKSTLLKLAAGLLEPSRGEIAYRTRPARELSRRAIALEVAFVAQSVAAELDFPVREVVAMGRAPHLGRFQPARKVDLRAIEDALAATDLTSFADRSFLELSGGERQRALVARAFAQGTDVLILDEPTASLDLRHAYDLLDCVLRWTRERGLGAFAAIHDLALASRFCDRLIVLDAGKVVRDGPPQAVLDEALLRDVFRVEAEIDWKDNNLRIGIRNSID